MNLEVPGFFKPGGGAFETENVLRRLRKNFGGKKENRFQTLRPRRSESSSVLPDFSSRPISETEKVLKLFSVTVESQNPVRPFSR